MEVNVMSSAPALPLEQQQHIILNVTWDGYVGIGEYLRDQPVRMTYDQGALEIMTLSLEHEKVKTLIGRMIETLTLELDIECQSGGSTTFARKRLNRGLEADECYWIQHEEEMRGKTAFKPGIDPPPDLALEVEISRGVLKRLGIYAALGVPEVWRYDGETFEVLVLGPDGQYQSSATSQALPMIPVAELARFLDLRQTLSEMQVVRRFRDWVRQQQAADWGAKKSRGRKKK